MNVFSKPNLHSVDFFQVHTFYDVIYSLLSKGISSVQE